MEKKIRQLLDLIKEYDKMKKVYLSCYESLSIIRDGLRAGEYELVDMVNFIYVMREISKFADDLRKEADGIGHMIENAVCVVYVTQNNVGPIRASLATGTPDLKMGVKIPNQKREPEKFQELMNFFKIPAKVVTARIVRPYWPGLCEYVSMLAEEGKPLPPGINLSDTYSTYKVIVKTYQNLDELLVQLQIKRKDSKVRELLTTRTKS